MTGHDTDGRWQLGRRLRELRRAAGLTQHKVAQALKCTQGKINKLERQGVRVNPQELERLIELYRVTVEEADTLRRLARHQANLRRATEWRRSSPAYEKLLAGLPSAAAVLNWHGERIPVALRSEQYMVEHLGEHDEPGERVAALLRRRRAAAGILAHPTPIDYQVILSESALWRMPGGSAPGLVVDQIEHLLGLTGRSSRLTLRILPFTAPLPYVDTDFVLVRFAEADRNFAYIEYPGGSRTIEKAAELNCFADHWCQLRDAALSPAQTTEFLTEFLRRTRETLSESSL